MQSISLIAVTFWAVIGVTAGATYNGELEVITSAYRNENLEDAYFKSTWLQGRVEIAVNAGTVHYQGGQILTLDTSLDADQRAAFDRDYGGHFHAAFADLTDPEAAAEIQQALIMLVNRLQQHRKLRPNQKLILYIKAGFDWQHFQPMRAQLFVRTTEGQLADQLWTTPQFEGHEGKLASFMLESELKLVR